MRNKSPGKFCRFAEKKGVWICASGGFLHLTLWLCGPDQDERCQLNQSDSFRLGPTYGLQGQSATLLAK